MNNSLDIKTMLLQQGKDITYNEKKKEEILDKNNKLSNRYFLIRTKIKPKLLKKIEEGKGTVAHRIKLKQIEMEQNKIRTLIIENNGGLILKIVSDQSRSKLNYGNFNHDLVMSGILGLLKALNEYDPKKGKNFSNYAFFWIRSEVKTAIGNEESIRIPNSTHAMIKKLEKMDSLGLCSVNDKKRLVKLKKSINRIGNGSISLSTNIGGDDFGNRELIDILPDQKSIDIAGDLGKNWEVGKISNIVFNLYRQYENSNDKSLSTRKKALLAFLLEYGIDHQKRFGVLSDRTLVEVATIFFFSPYCNKIYKRERIRQLREMALGEINKFVKNSGIKNSVSFTN